jgi:hypothetical protein
MLTLHLLLLRLEFPKCEEEKTSFRGQFNGFWYSFGTIDGEIETLPVATSLHNAGHKTETLLVATSLHNAGHKTETLLVATSLYNAGHKTETLLVATSLHNAGHKTETLPVATSLYNAGHKTETLPVATSLHNAGHKNFGTPNYKNMACLHVFMLFFNVGRYSDSLRAGRSEDRIPVEARFSAPVQTGPVAHPASYTMGTGSFPGVKRAGRGVALTTHPHLAPGLKKEYSYTSTPPLDLCGLF